MSEERKLLKPREVPPVPGAEDWKEMYPSYLTFDFGECGEVADWESKKFWFRNTLHWPRAIHPLDEFFVGGDQNFISQYTSRVYAVPTALGIPYRVLNGYIYNTSNETSDPQIIGERAKHFIENMKYCTENWEKLYEKWVENVKQTVKEIEALSFPELPERENSFELIKGKVTTTAYDVLQTNRSLWKLADKAWCHHFIFLGVIYAKYIELSMFCNAQGFGDAIETLVKGMTPLVLEPEERLKDLAKAAVELGIQDVFGKYQGEEILSQLERKPNGKQWIDRFNEFKYPNFLACESQSLYFDETSWIDDLDTLFHNINGYIEKLERGETIDRDVASLVKERDEKTAECYKKLKKEEKKKEFNRLLNETRKLYPFSEDHNYFIEFWTFGLIRKKVMELGDWLVRHGVMDEPKDILFFKRFELDEVLFDVSQGWASSIITKSSTICRKTIEKRKKMYDLLTKWNPPEMLGRFPDEELVEPFTVMLWGVTQDRINEWRSRSTEAEETKRDVKVIEGVAGSPGIVEGPAKVIERFSESRSVKNGDILVTPVTAPGWGPVLIRVKAVVLDSGGRMCHGAIIAREERVPAVVGCVNATTSIRTGDIIRVNGDEGKVEILERAGSE
jgi:pyruvate,water dikinase